MKYLLSMLLGAVLSATPATLDAAQKPNIVVIVADDLGYGDVLFNPRHAEQVSTPHLNSLAKESIICRQGYVSGHVCSPTRAGLMMGATSSGSDCTPAVKRARVCR